MKKGWKQFRHVSALTARAHKLMWRISRSYTILLYIAYIVERCIPFWEIYWMAKLLDEVLGRLRPTNLLFDVFCMVVGGCLVKFSNMLLANAVEQKAFFFTQKEKKMFIHKIMEMDYCLLEDEKTHMLYQRVNRESYGDGKNLQLLQTMIPTIISTFISIVLSIAMVKDFFIQMADYKGILLVSFVVIIVSIWIRAKCESADEANFSKCENKMSENTVQRDGYSRYLDEYGNGKDIRIYRIGDLLIQRLMEAHTFNDEAYEERNRNNLKYNTISAFAKETAMILIRCVAAFAGLVGKISIGNMTQYVESILVLSQRVSQFWSCLIAVWYNAEYLERYFTFLDTESHMRKGCIPVEKRADREYKIVFDHVSFRYPHSEQYALKDINLEFKIGEKLAIVGKNGSGKSTFIKLLCRLYDPTEGTIFMNGIDIRRYDYKEYMRLFSIVFQDFKLFSFGLGENIAVAEDYESERVEHAVKKAGLQLFLEKQKNGLKTTLYREFDKDGVEVSGGEEQKIALARAVYKGAPFVVLDEPTASLDPMAEYEIYTRFNELVSDRTTVYISHRMSSCRFCGDIAVFCEGKLVQRGNHEELMREESGEYHHLWIAQAQYYTI